MISTDTQKTQFNSRLTRIKKGGANTLGHVYVGPVEEATEPKRQRRSGLATIILVFLVGGAAYFVGHLAQFHLAGDWERLGPQALMVAEQAGDLIVAALVLAIFFRLTRMRGLGPVMAGVVGLGAMMALHGFSVKMAPDLYTGLYSEGYVSDVVNGEAVSAF